MLTPPIKPILRTGKAGADSSCQNSQPMELPAGVAPTKPSFADSPLFPEKVYQALPQLLLEGSGVFKSRREKDVFLVSAIAVLSGCMPTVRGVYDGAEVQANLFVFVVAPAGSGKGALTWARILGIGYHKSKTESSEQARLDFEQRAAEARADKQPFMEQPPPYRSFYLPGNSSAAAFMKALKENDETGVICESEADTLSGALKQDWGDYSDLMRKSFHHETGSYLRKSGERYEIERPSLSVVLSGTPGQVNKLIPDAENGLFSRFLFYCFENEPVWHDVSPAPNRVSLNGHFGQLAERVKNMTQDLQNRGSITFDLSDSQWRVLNEQCPYWLADAIDDTGRSFSGSVYRLGLIVFRLAMVLTILQQYEDGELITNAECGDYAFSMAMDMAKVMLEHSKLMYATMPKPGGVKADSSKQDQCLRSLPTTFDRAQADEVGRTIGISERTVTNYLQRLATAGRIQKTEHGHYQKA